MGGTGRGCSTYQCLHRRRRIFALYPHATLVPQFDLVLGHGDLPVAAMVSVEKSCPRQNSRHHLLACTCLLGTRLSGSVWGKPHLPFLAASTVTYIHLSLRLSPPRNSIQTRPTHHVDIHPNLNCFRILTADFGFYQLRPFSTMASPTSPSPPSAPAEEEAENAADMPLTLAASVVLDQLPKDATQALETAGELSQPKGPHYPSIQPNIQPGGRETSYLILPSHETG